MVGPRRPANDEAPVDRLYHVVALIGVEPPVGSGPERITLRIGPNQKRVGEGRVHSACRDESAVGCQHNGLRIFVDAYVLPIRPRPEGVSGCVRSDQPGIRRPVGE